MNEESSRASSLADVPFSAEVVQLISDARRESARCRHEYLGTEHLMLALSQRAGDAAPLRALAIDSNRVYLLIDETIRRGNVALASDLDRPFTSRTKHAFSLAAQTARELEHTQIGVAHVLVGLMRERLNIGAQVLADQGLTEERAYEYARDTGSTTPS